MGVCLSFEDKDSAKIDAKLAADHKKKLAAKNILLLGPGESGKSTFMKQLTHKYGTGYDPEEFRPIIYRNVIYNMCHLVTHCEKWARNAPLVYSLDPQNSMIAENVKELEEQYKKLDVNKMTHKVFDATVAKAVTHLWNDPAIQAVYDQRSRLQLLDSSEYFFERVDVICQPDYVPSTEDIILSRVRTTGYSQATFQVDGNPITVTDVGGQRSERKKWMHFFETCTTIVFFAAISEYDMTMYEKTDVNRFKETLTLFQEICGSRWFKDIPLILFMNKVDLFQEKVQKVPIGDWIPEFKGESNFEDGKEFIQKLFEDRSFGRDIYPHFTCVINGNSIGDLFSDVSHVIKAHPVEQTLEDIIDHDMDEN